MKNLKLTAFFLSFLACTITLPGDTEFIETQFEEPIIDKKAKMKYTGIRYQTELIKTPEEMSEENIKRSENFKKFTKKEQAAKKIQSWLRSTKEDRKIEDFKRKHAATKLQRASRQYLQEKKINTFKKSIDAFADQSYPKFKELICTSDYLTKTDWIYKFIETMENKTIFARDKNGNIDPNTFTQEFEKENSNPSDWLDTKIIDLLPQFHEIIYKTFIDKAVEQIIKYKTSWIDAVSIPTPKDHGSFQEESTPLFPKIYKCSKCPHVHLILAKIFTNVLEEDPERLKDLDIHPTITPYNDTVTDSDGITYKDFTVQAFDQDDIITIRYKASDPHFDESAAIMEEIEKEDIILTFFTNYLDKLGLEFSSEEETLRSMIGEEYFEPKAPDRIFDPAKDTVRSWNKMWDDYNNQLDKLYDESNKFTEDHINWGSSARQTFFLGQLIFDKSLPAFEALGGQQWLSKQPKDMQEYITKFIDKIKNKRLKRFKQQEIGGKPVHAKKISSKYQFEPLPSKK